MSDPVVSVVDLKTLTVTMGDGTVLPITNLFDSDGEDCEPDDAVAIVAGTDDYGWLDIAISEKETVH